MSSKSIPMVSMLDYILARNIAYSYLFTMKVGGYKKVNSFSGDILPSCVVESNLFKCIIITIDSEFLALH